MNSEHAFHTMQNMCKTLNAIDLKCIVAREVSVRIVDVEGYLLKLILFSNENDKIGISQYFAI